ncbi:MAG: Ig-like domain-containing protein, partial [Chthoniobacterales bacterium]
MKKATQSAILLKILLLITALLFFPSFSQTAPVSEETPASFITIVKGSNYSIGLKSDGTVWGWGSNDHGQLGVEKSVTSVSEDSPVEMKTLSGPLDQITDIISYHDISYALRLDGSVWSAGDESNKSDLAQEIPGTGNIISFSTQQGELLFQKRDGGFYKSDGTFYQPGTNIPFYQASATPLLSVSSLTAGSELPDSWQLEYFGYTGVDPSLLAPSGNGKTILECYLEGIDPTEALPEEPFALSLSAEGPYRARANVTLVANVTHPEGRDISKIEFYFQGQCLATNTERPYEFTTNYSEGQFLIEAIAYDSSGRTATGSNLITIEPSNWYSRGLGTDPKYKSSLIAIDEGKGVFLDKTDDFQGKYATFPWFLRTDSGEKDPCHHVMVDPANPTYVGREAVNTIPQTNGVSVGGAPAMVAFGSEGRGDSLYINQDYHFGILCGIPKVENGLKIEVYDKDDFSSGKTNVKPAVVRSYNLPNPKNRDEWEDFYQKGHLKEIHLQENIHGKMADFETQVQYSSGGPSDTLGMALPYYPLLVTHRAANNNFYYKVSFQGEAVDPKNPSQRIAMSLPSSNISYTLDFENAPAWSAAILSDPHFQRSLLPSQYQGKSVDELIHQTPEVRDTLSTLESSGFTKEQLTKVDNSPELKSHHELDKLSDMLGNNPMVIAN